VPGAADPMPMIAVKGRQDDIGIMDDASIFRLLTIPNALSLARLFAAPAVAMAVLRGWNGFAGVLFMAAAVTDALDGHLARRWALRSSVGAVLDALADKLLMALTVLALWARDAMAWPVVAIIVGRDLAIVGAVLAARMMGRPITVRPLMVSKLNTVVQFVLVAVALADRAGLRGAAPFIDGLVWLTLCLTGISALAYLIVLVAHVRPARC